MEFKPGDVVVLKSGSLKMTVSRVNDGTAWCEWFGTNHAPQGKAYDVAVLKLYE